MGGRSPLTTLRHTCMAAEGIRVPGTWQLASCHKFWCARFARSRTTAGAKCSNLHNAGAHLKGRRARPGQLPRQDLPQHLRQGEGGATSVMSCKRAPQQQQAGLSAQGSANMQPITAMWPEPGLPHQPKAVHVAGGCG